jgi:GH15 family glucan-1,4-alpha-glucosidase
MNSYPLISEHGLIGDLQTAALVSTGGTVDWLCLPRFDSPSVFGSLLDADRGGRFRIAPEGTNYVTKQLYFPDTAVLITRFMSPDGVGEVADFMSVDDPYHASARHQLIRVLRVVRGQMTFILECQPRFDYGRAEHRLRAVGDGFIFETDEMDLALRATVELQRDGSDVRARWTMRAGDVGGAILESGADRQAAAPIGPEGVLSRFNETVRFWRGWLGRSTYTGRWREAISRSAMTLKLMTYAPTGALVAAPTTSLPEQVGGERNWDYRFTWVRDASFSVYALLGLGYTDEAMAFLRWLRDRVGERAGRGSGPLKIMYRIDGSSDLHEETLDHFEGYRGSAPVHVGNGASDQLQLDIYGEAMDSLYRASRQGGTLGHEAWLDICMMMDWLAEHWDEPEEGIWETRGGRKNFTYGRLMSWVAMDRSIRMAHELGRPADVERWTKERDRIYRQIMDRGWNKERAGLGQSGVPLRSRRVPGRPGRLRRNVLDLHVLVRRRPGSLRPARRGSDDVREDADLRQPCRAVLRGDWADGRAAGQLSPSLHAPVADQRRDEPGFPARPRAGMGRSGARDDQRSSRGERLHWVIRPCPGGAGTAVAASSA